MAVTVSLYNNTVKRFMSGENASGDSYLINLYTAATFDATATTKTAAESGATQVATNYGYTQNSKTLAGVAVTVVSTNDAKFDADDVQWDASGGDIAASHAIVFNASDSNYPVLFVDFGGTVTAVDGMPFLVAWHASGILTGAV